MEGENLEIKDGDSSFFLVKNTDENVVTGKLCFQFDEDSEVETYDVYDFNKVTFCLVNEKGANDIAQFNFTDGKGKSFKLFIKPV
jgi:hypothetical protein